MEKQPTYVVRQEAHPPGGISTPRRFATYKEDLGQASGLNLSFPWSGINQHACNTVPPSKMIHITPLGEVTKEIIVEGDGDYPPASVVCSSKPKFFGCLQTS